MKNKKFVPLFLSTAMLFGIGIVSCGDGGSQQVVTEKVALKVTTLNVTITGVEEGTEYGAGDVLSFTLTTKTGYAIKEVIVCGHTQVISENGQYSYTITEEDVEKDNVLIYASASLLTHSVSGSITMSGKEIPSEYATFLSVTVGSASTPIKVENGKTTFSFSSIAEGSQSVAVTYSFDGGSKTYEFKDKINVNDDITNYNLDLPEHWIGDTFKFYGNGEISVPFTEGNSNANKQIYTFAKNGRVTQNFEFTYNLKFRGAKALVDNENNLVADPFEGKLPGDSVKFELQMWPDGTGTEIYPGIEFNKNTGWKLVLISGEGESTPASLSADIIKKLDSEEGLTFKLSRENYLYTFAVVDGDNVLASTTLNISSSLPQLMYIDCHLQFDNAKDFDFGTLGNYGVTYSNFEGIASLMDRSPVSGTFTLEDSIDSKEVDDNLANASLIDINMVEYPVTITKTGDTYTFKGEAIKGKYLLRILGSKNELLFESGTYFDVDSEGSENVKTKLYRTLQTYKTSLTTSNSTDSVYFGCGGNLDVYPSEDYIYQQTLRLAGVNYFDYFNEDGTFKSNANNKITLENRLWLTTQDIKTTPAPNSTSRYNTFIQTTDGTDWVIKTDWNNYAIDNKVAAYASDLTTDEVKALITDGLVINYVSIGNTILTSTIDNNGVYREHIATQYQRDWSESLELYAVDARDRTNASETTSGKTRVITNSRVLNLGSIESVNVFPTFAASTMTSAAEASDETVANTSSGEKKFSKENCELGTDAIVSFDLVETGDAKDKGTITNYSTLYVGTDNPDDLVKRNFRVGYKANTNGKGYAFAEFEDGSNGTITRELDNNSPYSDLELTNEQLSAIKGSGLRYYIRNDFSQTRQKFHVYVDNGLGSAIYLCTVNVNGTLARVTGYGNGSSATKEGATTVTEEGKIENFKIWAYSNGNANTSMDQFVKAINEYTPIF